MLRLEVLRPQGAIGPGREQHQALVDTLRVEPPVQRDVQHVGGGLATEAFEHVAEHGLDHLGPRVALC